MKRYQMEVQLRDKYGSSIGWLANVINCWQHNPTKRIKGLAKLAEANRVAPSGTMDYILIDGKAVSWGELEQYA